MLASFSVIPIGSGAELKTAIAEAIKLVDESGLPYKVGPMQTTVEGEGDQVMGLIMRCHARMLELCPRVHTQILIDDRKGASGRLEGKVEDVEKLLGKPLR